MTALGIFRLIVHLFAGLATCAFLFPFINVHERDRKIQLWSRKLLGICGVKARHGGTPSVNSGGRVMVVSNHVSWLDIFVINSLYPCRFVAKSEIRDWPLIGWLCEKTGTIFIARGRQRDVRRIYESLVDSLQQGQRIAFFPEGTTAPQGTMLPFHANLFEAPIEALAQVQPCAIRYLDGQGQLHHAADFVDEMSFLQSISAILGARAMTAELTFLPQISTEGAHRRELAVQAHDAIKAALRCSST